jgi:two-component system chemotaxis response regulator CheB
VIRILVIDDSALMRKLMRHVLSDVSDFDVFFARNGVEGLEQLGLVNPDVVTLDVQMPVMDGLACLDRIMVEHPCPVVMVSSQTGEGAEATLEALRIGAVDFVAKPEGAVSLQMEAFGPLLVAKVRAAAGAKLRSSLRLRERVVHRMSGSTAPRRKTSSGEGPPPRAAGSGVVLVGVSTGGPPALEALLTGLPSSFPWPIMVVQHMPATFTGPLARRLDDLCAIEVTEVLRAIALAPGCAYIAHGDADMVVTRRAGALMAAPAAARARATWRPSVNRLVDSALEHVVPEQLIGVLMTGMGNDGAGSMFRLRSLGGKTIAESEETAVVWGMPGELAKTGGADWVLPLPEIAGQLMQLVPAIDAPRS